MAKRNRMLVLAAIPLAMLSACGGTVNRGLESVHQPVISHTNYALDVSTDGYRLSNGERDRLAGWFASLRLSYGDSVAIDDPTGGNDGIRADIANVVADYGLFLAPAAPITEGTLAPGSVRVVVTRSTASVPNCPDYSRLANHEFLGNTTSNYGCASNSNLAAMVARADDLVRGQSGVETADPAVSAKAIQTFRRRSNTGASDLKNEGTSR